MHILAKKMWTLAVALPVAALVACTTDAPEQIITPMGQVIDADEYDELVEAGKVDEMGNVIVEDEDDDTGSDVEKSSASKTGTSSSSTKETSGDATSSSAGGDKATSSAGGDTATSSVSGDNAASSSSGEKTASSSGTENPASSGTAPASSSATAPASSSATPASSETPASSSSAAASSSGTAPASSATPASSSATPTSSSAVPGQTTISNISGDTGDFSVGQNDMVEVADDVQSELDSLKEILDNGGTVDGFEKTDMEFNEETLPVEIFDEQDFFCFTGEGEWLRITKEMLGTYIPHYKNDHAWGNLRHFDIKFMDACAAVYIKRK